jgi:tRNA(Ile)-lysidine synthase
VDDLRAHVAAYAEAHGLLPAPGAAPVVVGVSGGLDSVALFHLLARMGHAVAAAHVHYGLRGPDADADAACVRALATRHGAACYLARRDADAEAARRGTSRQDAARALRYAFFAAVAAQTGSAHVAVAHHRRDQAETLLLHLVRGAGPEGLAAMPPRRPLLSLPHAADAAGPALVRPLLSAPRAAVRAYAEAEGLRWRVDASNRTLAYRRNVVRHRVLPLLEETFAGATGRLAHAAAVLRGYLDATLAPDLARRWAAVTADAAPRTLRAEALAAQPPVWRRRLVLEALARWLPQAPATDAFAAEVEALVGAQVGRRVEAGGGVVWRVRDGLRVEAAAPAAVPPTPVPWDGAPVRLPDGALRVRLLPAPPPTLDPGTPHVAYADADRLGYPRPLTARRWQPGDRLRPLGMDGTKTVADLLTDARVPPPVRARACVLLDADGRLAWVIGHRLAHAARVRPATRRVARLAWE